METDRLVQLAGDLLLLAGSERGELPLRVEPVEACEVLESVRNRFAWRAAESGRSLQVVAPPDLALTCDRLRLEQALGNLVDNALRHGEGAVVLDARASGDHVELHVRDEGPGIPPTFLPHAFRRFSRADASQAGPGAGLGLAIVDSIARAHDGHAEGSTGGACGSDVWITVPRG